MKTPFRFLSFVLTLLFVLTSLSVFSLSASAEPITVTAHGLDRGRGSGELIIYTSSFGAKTATNEWGSEAVVGADNIVTAVGQNNSAIPIGGFVVSGHDSDSNGKMKTWVNENIHVGDYVYYDPNTLVVTVSKTPLDLKNNGFYELDRNINGFNTTRNENFMVIYTPSHGSSTHTNEYGMEVIVENGLVVSIGGNDQPIPQNGFVLSGHGDSATWILKNVRIGMRITYDRNAKTAHFIYDAESLKSGLQAALNALEPKYQNAKANYLYVDYKTFEEGYASVKAEYAKAVSDFENGGKESDFLVACELIKATVQSLNDMLVESYNVQYRAVWLRPSQKTRAEVDRYVKELHDAGINTICVEGIFDNSVIMTVPEGSLFEHNPTFSYDVLQAYIDACHKYGMECHLWMAIYHVGNFGQTTTRRSVGYKKPEWISRHNGNTTDNPDSFIMLDPANVEAREYLLSFYEYILKTYDIDCFQLDYIRYYNSRGSVDYGYTEAAFKGFKQAYGYTEDPKYDTNAPYWNDWVQFRKDSITEMVRGVRELIDTYRPSVLLSADVVPNPDTAGLVNYQDYLEWQRRGYLDLLHPMAYGDGFGESIKKQVNIGSSRCMVVTGLGIFTDSLNAADMVRQSSEDNALGAYGEAFFEASSYLRKQTGTALLRSVYRNEALAPFLDPDASLTATLEYMSGRVKDILLPLGGVTEAEASALQTAIENASASVKDARVAPEQLKALRSVIASVSDVKAKAALNGDLLRTERISCVVYNTKSDKLLDELTVKDDPGATGVPQKPQKTEETSEESNAEDTVSEVKTSFGTGSVLMIVLIVLLSLAACGLIGFIIFTLRKK